MNTTPHQAKYFAHELTCMSRNNDAGDLTGALMSAQVDLNPHQIEAALFALKNPLNEGIMLADEVGLGKTVEAGLVLCQLWAERKRRLIVVCPSSLRKQWQEELREKFALPAQIAEKRPPEQFSDDVWIMSYQFAAKYADRLRLHGWDCVVLDEAHKLRNTHKDSNKTGKALLGAFSGCKKLLLTATPLQNSLMELYGLSQFLDPYLFGDEKQFRRDYISQNNTAELQERLAGFIQRTLRRDVREYVSYTQRHAFTQHFTPSDEEDAFYQNISAFLQREESYALPRRQRHLTALILRKLLASSPYAVLDTLQKIRTRLLKLQSSAADINAPFKLFEDDDWESYEEDWEDNDNERSSENTAPVINKTRLAEEIRLIESFIRQAEKLCLGTDSKAQALLEALTTGFAKMAERGAAQKAMIFTESVRTQKHLADFLHKHGYAGQTVLFNGSNNDATTNDIYQKWLNNPANQSRITGAATADKRAALIDHFKHSAQIMIATEAAAEGVNLQFCSLLVNYDLPWNPQRVEQRIGRCHRYGQKFDVVVINFLNRRNEADRRILELLTEKFQLFDGLFGASNDILGRVENADLDFEKRIAQIFDTCRTPQDIETAFNRLQKELEDAIAERMDKTAEKLQQHFDQDVRERLKMRHSETQQRLNLAERWFWRLAQYVLQPHAEAFDHSRHSFRLTRPPIAAAPVGQYAIKAENAHPFRPNTDLGEWCIRHAAALPAPAAEIVFDYTRHPDKISDMAHHKGKSGWLRLDKLTAKSDADTTETLVFTAFDDNGETLDADFCRHLLALSGSLKAETAPPERLETLAQSHLAQARVRQKGIADKQIQEANIRLLLWEKDQVDALDKELTEAKLEEKREKFRATTLTDSAEILASQQLQDKLHRQVRKLRRTLEEREEAIAQERQRLTDSIKAKMKQQSSNECLLVVRWEIV